MLTIIEVKNGVAEVLIGEALVIDRDELINDWDGETAAELWERWPWPEVGIPDLTSLIETLNRSPYFHGEEGRFEWGFCYDLNDTASVFIDLALEEEKETNEHDKPQ